MVMIETTGPAPSFGFSDSDDPIFNPDASPTYTGPTRTERDSLGEMEIPADAYWGIHTARALHNFPITRRALSNFPDFVRALVRVKHAAALANKEIGVLDAKKADLIVEVCEEIYNGALHDEFVLGMLQGGAGTSTNMSTNEIIANRALEKLGHNKGEYEHFQIGRAHV